MCRRRWKRKWREKRRERRAGGKVRRRRGFRRRRRGSRVRRKEIREGGKGREESRNFTRFLPEVDERKRRRSRRARE